jgi:hypothetical protein
MTRESILSIVDTIARLSKSDDGAVVAELMREGLSETDAEFSVVFVPLAFGRAIIPRIPSCEGLSLPEEAEIPSHSGLERIHLACVPHFSIARGLAEEAFDTGLVGREKFMSVSLRSAEMQVINQALNSGTTLKGGTMSPPLLLRLGDLKQKKKAQPDGTDNSGASPLRV